MADKTTRRAAPTHLGNTVQVQVHVPDEGQEENRELVRSVRVRRQGLLTPGQWWILWIVMGTFLTLLIIDWVYPTLDIPVLRR
jgi:hypothetical protein